jgi:excisionase family DNA binding protein
MVSKRRATDARGPDPPAHDDLLTLPAAAQRTGLSLPTIYGWLRSGQLTSIHIGRWYSVRPTDLAAVQAQAHLGSVLPAWQANRRRAGQRLRAVREAAGFSQLTLAGKTGLTHEAISRLELGLRAPRAATVRALAEALGVAPELFIGDEPIGLTMLTAAEAAFRLDVPVGRLGRWLREGELPGTKVAGRWHVPAVIVQELGRSGRLRGQSRRLDPRYRG